MGEFKFEDNAENASGVRIGKPEMPTYTIGQIRKFLDVPTAGGYVDITLVKGVSSLNNYKFGTLTLLRNLDPETIDALIEKAPCACLITEMQNKVLGWSALPKLCCFIVCENTKIALNRIIEKFFPQLIPSAIHDMESYRSEGRVIIYPGVTIGEGVVIGANSVIGCRGYSYVKDGDELVRLHHIGGVVIEENVEIGNNTCIDRGSMGDTVIGRGTKIDNLVHIAHDVKIGRNCLIVAGAIICGYCEIGDNTRIAPGAVVRDRVKVGKDCLVGFNAVVTKDLPDGSKVMGIPAEDTEMFVRRRKAVEDFIK